VLTVTHTCLPYILDPNVSAGSEEEPLHRNQQVARNVWCDCHANKEYWKRLQHHNKNIEHDQCQLKTRRREVNVELPSFIYLLYVYSSCTQRTASKEHKLDAENCLFIYYMMCAGDRHYFLTNTEVCTRFFAQKITVNKLKLWHSVKHGLNSLSFTSFSNVTTKTKLLYSRLKQIYATSATWWIDR